MRRILIVDPDSMTRSQLSLALRHWGYGVAEAHDGGDAFAKVNNESADLILLSDTLPVGGYRDQDLVARLGVQDRQ